MGSIRARKESGCLFVDFRYRNERCRELTALTDTASNRKRLEKLLEKIEADIASDTFDYRRYFPTSRNAAKFDQAPMAEAISTLSAALAGAEVPILNAANADQFAPQTPPNSAQGAMQTLPMHVKPAPQVSPLSLV